MFLSPKLFRLARSLGPALTAAGLSVGCGSIYPTHSDEAAAKVDSCPDRPTPLTVCPCQVWVDAGALASMESVTLSAITFDADVESMIDLACAGGIHQSDASEVILAAPEGAEGSSEVIDLRATVARSALIRAVSRTGESASVWVAVDSGSDNDRVTLVADSETTRSED